MSKIYWDLLFFFVFDIFKLKYIYKKINKFQVKYTNKSAKFSSNYLIMFLCVSYIKICIILKYICNKYKYINPITTAGPYIVILLVLQS